jgi:hypothetical protein
MAIEQEIDDTQKYLIRTFQSNSKMQEFANWAWPKYYCKTISSTGHEITALFERNDGDD